MDIPKNVKRVVITIGPPDKPYVEILLPDKRTGENDRRISPTLVALDQRSGVADRRNSNSD
jgi:hypothetical protein